MSGEHSIKTLCAVLTVSRSGYYSWQNAGESARARETRELTERIARLTEQADREHVLIDSTAVRVHAHGSGPAGGSLAQAMGRSRASVLGQDPHGLWAPWVIRWDLS
jgi:hypothetical protein